MNDQAQTREELLRELQDLRGKYDRLTASFQKSIAANIQTEDQLLTEHVFRNSIELSLSSGIAIVDKEGRQIYVNPAFCKLVGWSKEELTGKAAPFIYWPSEHLKSIDNAFLITLANQAPKEGFELVFIRKDGVQFPVQVIISPFTDGNVISGWLAMLLILLSAKGRKKRCM